MEEKPRDVIKAREVWQMKIYVEAEAEAEAEGYVVYWGGGGG